MNNEQLLETLKGLTATIEEAITTNNVTADEESLHQAFLCGARWVLEDLRDLGRTEHEINVEASDEDGSYESMTLTSRVNIFRTFMDEQSIYDSCDSVKAERYCEKLKETEIRAALQEISLIPADADTATTPEPTTDA